MSEIRSLTCHIVDQTRDFTEEIVNRVFPDLEAQCPECDGTTMRQTDGVFECRNPECSFRIKKHIASHELTEAEARELITNLRVGPIDTFKNRFGQPFTAELTLGKEKRSWKINFVFEGDDERESELDNLSEEQVICEAPLLDDSDKLVKVYENERAYLAPDMAKAADERGVRISKTILQREIPQEQAKKLFVEGKTDLMPGFLSKKGRKFAAHLTLDRKSGKLGFEFAPRKSAKKKDEEQKASEGDSAATDAGTTVASKDAPAKKPKKKATKKSS